jgi:tellurite resistance protein TehA-like permease
MRQQMQVPLRPRDGMLDAVAFGVLPITSLSVFCVGSRRIPCAIPNRETFLSISMPQTSEPNPAQGIIADLNPSDFALVMATGIVSLACHLHGMGTIAHILFWMNVPAFLVLATLTTIRLVRYPRRFFHDLIDHQRGVGFFTVVAASGILGNQFLLMAHWRTLAVILWCVSIGLGFVITYTLFAAFAVKKVKPSLAEGIHGGWLLAVVAIQSISVLGTLLASGFGAHADQVLFYALAMWLVGGKFYIWIISLIFYRYSFFPMTPGDLSPPYWINMGAMAISTLAGATLLSATPQSELLLSVAPFVKGLTLLFWATASWWIPMLVILGIWRHGYMRYPLTYDSQYWGAVFPLGMYSVATYRLAHALDQPFLLIIPQVFLCIALGTWCIVFAGLARNSMRVLYRWRTRAPAASG